MRAITIGAKDEFVKIDPQSSLENDQPFVTPYENTLQVLLVLFLMSIDTAS